MAGKYKKGPTGTSFKGAFVYPKLSDVDYGSDEYPQPDGRFSVGVKGSLDDPKVKAWIAKYQPMHDEAIARAKAAFKKLKPETRKKLKSVTVQPLYETLYDEDEKPTGEIVVKFAMRYSGEYKSGKREGETWYRTPAIFDASGKQMIYFREDDDGVPHRVKSMPDIWGGTVGRIAFEVGIDKEGNPGYFIPATGVAGLSFKLEAARIIDLVTKGQRTASSYFGEDDEDGDGYSYDAPVAPADADETDDGGEEETKKPSRSKARKPAKGKAKAPVDDDAGDEDEDDTDF